jgi:hypothetical protein
MAKSTFTREGLFLLAVALGGVGCGSSTSSGGTTGSDTPAGVVLGPLDHHCVAGDGGLIVQTIGVCETPTPPANAAMCTVKFANDTSAADGGDPSASDGGAAPVSDYGPTMYGSAGNDDDCKYYVSWTSTPIVEKAATYFTLSAWRLSDMTPATCAAVIPDTSLSLTHGVAPPAQPSPEIAPGVYKVGPIPFDAPGIWTVRFHLFEECSDDPPDSPHGHAAFYVNVP